MKRLIAKKKLKWPCTYCGKQILKGDVYYKDRQVITEFDDLITFKTYAFGWNEYICPKCKYKREQHERRFKNFKEE